MLRYPASSVSLAGFVELREESQKTDRFVLRVERIEGNRIVDKPERVRLSVRRGMAPPAGAFVEVKAQLNPPLQPLRPGSYDFARDLYFQRIGASGFVHGAVKVVTPPAAATARMRVNAFIQGLRDAIDARIRSVLSGDVGSIASALITGKRDAITPHVYDAMFVSGIGHVLSISGYHMAVVAGIVFFILRALLALIPGLADRDADQEMGGVRRAARDGVLSRALRRRGRDAALVHHDRDRAHRRHARPAGADASLGDDRRFGGSVVRAGSGRASELPDVVRGDAGADRRLRARLALGAGRQRQPRSARAPPCGASTRSLACARLAGRRSRHHAVCRLHFHRLAPYGVLANLLAMPVVSAWVMPMGILGVLAMPFGFDGMFWRQMGYGIEWMDAVALWVASLPGAFGRVTSFGTGPLLLATAGLL